jgi:hypothetical protein
MGLVSWLVTFSRTDRERRSQKRVTESASWPATTHVAAVSFFVFVLCDNERRQLAETKSGG